MLSVDLELPFEVVRYDGMTALATVTVPSLAGLVEPESNPDNFKCLRWWTANYICKDYSINLQDYDKQCCFQALFSKSPCDFAFVWQFRSTFRFSDHCGQCVLFGRCRIVMLMDIKVCHCFWLTVFYFKCKMQLLQIDVEILMPLQTPVWHHTTLRIEDADVTFGWNVERPNKELMLWEKWSQGAFPGVDRGQTRLPIDSWNQIPLWMSACFIHESLAAFLFTPKELLDVDLPLDYHHIAIKQEKKKIWVYIAGTVILKISHLGYCWWKKSCTSRDV